MNTESIREIQQAVFGDEKTKQHGLLEVVFGNGKPGVITRLIALEFRLNVIIIVLPFIGAFAIWLTKAILSLQVQTTVITGILERVK